MKQILLILMAAALVACGKKEVAANDSNSGSLIQTGDTKECYWCKEESKAAALACKHCGSKNPLGPLKKDSVVDEVVREQLDKPTGELTEANLASVTYLGLIETKITAAGLKEMVKLRNLTSLYMFRTKITDAGLKEIAKLQHLTDLSLSYTKITDENAAELKKALPNCEDFTHYYDED
jgi:hypothetical protein